MSEVKPENSKYTKVVLARTDDLGEYAEYGFQSCTEVPTKKRNITVSDKAYEDIERIRHDLGETQGNFCGRILTEAVQSDYRPIAKSLQKNYKLQMEQSRIVCAYLRESDNAKLDKLADSLGLKTGDYMRLTLYSALKGWKQQ